MDFAMGWKMFAGTIGGLGMFLFGMKLMSDGLQKAAGKGLKTILEKLTSNRYIGVTVGMLVTAIIQSSSATTVMVVGFVNAGLMNLLQAMSVILGANIGTTMTAQLIAFKLTVLALPAIGLGVALKMFSKKMSWASIGEIILGFGLLFYGMNIMTHALSDLKDQQFFVDMFVTFSHNPILAVFAGAILTMIVQSSSATIGITMALATNGLLDFPAAAALVMGENIGTTITANLAAIGTSRAARRSAVGHFLFNFLGVVWMLIFLKYFVLLVDYMTPGVADFVAADGTKPDIARHIANIHSSFNIINTILFLPFLEVLVYFSEKIVKGDEEEGYKLVHLDDKILNTPEIAAQQARKEVARMSNLALDMLYLSKQGLFKRDTKAIEQVYKLEDTVDLLEKDISVYLVKLIRQPLSDRASGLIDSMQHVLHDIEKIADHAENVARFTERMMDKGVVFSDEAMIEAERIFDTVISFARATIDAYNQHEDPVKVETGAEDEIDLMRRDFKNNHMNRLRAGQCSVDAGIIYVDILNNLEKVGDHTFNIAQVVSGTHKDYRHQA